MKRLIFIFLLFPFLSKGQVYQSMPQAGYGPIKRILTERDGVLSIPLYTGTLGNIAGGRDTGQIRYRLSDSSIYVYSGSQWLKIGGSGSTDTSSLSNRINLKLNISDTASMLADYIRLAGWGLNKTGQTLMVDTSLVPSQYRLDTMRNNIYATINSIQGGSQNLQQVTHNGNVTDTTIRVEYDPNNGQIDFLRLSAMDGSPTSSISATFDDNYRPFMYFKNYSNDTTIILFGDEGVVRANYFQFYSDSSDNRLYQWQGHQGNAALVGSYIGLNTVYLGINPLGDFLYGHTYNGVNPVLRWQYDFTKLTQDRTFYQPDRSGTPIMTINGNAPDSTGAITVSGSSQWITTGADTIDYPGNLVNVSNGGITALGDVTSLAGNIIGGGGSFQTLFVGGPITFNGLQGSHNASDSMLVVATDGTVGYRPISDGANKLDKSISSYSIPANNTNATADMAAHTFKYFGSQNLPALTWTSSADPTSITKTYTWSQIGKMVTINFYINASSAGTGVTGVAFDLPPDMPLPLEQAGTGAASESLYVGSGVITTSTTNQATTTTRSYLRVNSGDTGYEIFIPVASIAAKVAIGTLTYTAQ